MAIQVTSGWPVNQPTGDTLRPGDEFIIIGSGFGTGPLSTTVSVKGRQHSIDDYEANCYISEWAADGYRSSNGTLYDYFKFRVPDSIIPLKAYASIKFWDGSRLEGFDLYLKPFYNKFTATLFFKHSGGAFGISENHAVLQGVSLPIPAVFSSVDAGSNQNGHAAIIDPRPTALPYYLWDQQQDLQSHYHIGLPAWQDTVVWVTYTVVAPRGQRPQPIPGADWVMVGAGDV